MGKVYCFYSPRRGAGLTTLIVKISKWLAGHTELNVCILDFTDRKENACIMTGNTIEQNSFLQKELEYKKELPLAICGLETEKEEAIAVLRKAQEKFDIIFIDLSNRLDTVAQRVFDFSQQIILVAPGTETVVRYFRNLLELSHLLGNGGDKQVNLLLSKIRHQDEIAVLTDEIQDKMIGFLPDEPGDDSIQQVADTFYYDYYLQKLTDSRERQLQAVVKKMEDSIRQSKDGRDVGKLLWEASGELGMAFNKRLLLVRWLFFRATLGQTVEEAAAELIPRFLAMNFNELAGDLSVEAAALASPAAPEKRADSMGSSA